MLSYSCSPVVFLGWGHPYGIKAWCRVWPIDKAHTRHVHPGKLRCVSDAFVHWRISFRHIRYVEPIRFWTLFHIFSIRFVYPLVQMNLKNFSVFPDDCYIFDILSNRMDLNQKDLIFWDASQPTKRNGMSRLDNIAWHYVHPNQRRERNSDLFVIWIRIIKQIWKLNSFPHHVTSSEWNECICYFPHNFFSDSLPFISISVRKFGNFQISENEIFIRRTKQKRNTNV